MKNFKKNIWMYGIIGLYVGFAVMMISFAVLASHHHVDLVVSDYYKAEINYQKQINKINNYNNLVLKPDIQIDSIGHTLKVVFRGYDDKLPVNGRLCFYRPDNQKDDDTVALDVNESGIADYSLKKFEKGSWRVRMEWQKDTTQYFVEEKFKLK